MPDGPGYVKRQVDIDVKKIKKGVLLLGHGSRRIDANATLKDAARLVEDALDGAAVVRPAFLQLAPPDIQEAVDGMAAKGINDLTVVPYFLYEGLHVVKDIPDELDAALRKHPGIEVRMTKNLGLHDKLIEVVLERIRDAGALEKAGAIKGFTQHPIERESFRIIGEELGRTGFSGGELGVVKRVIHTTADFDFKDIIRFSEGAIKAGITAVKNGKNIVTDVKMAKEGISRERLNGFGCGVYCFSSDMDVIATAEREKTTRTAASMRKAASYLDAGIAVIGNAPTALSELLRLVRLKKARPALIIGVPVGFVGATESKEELMKSGSEYIVAAGRKGGSTVATAIMNAVVIEAMHAYTGRVSEP